MSRKYVGERYVPKLDGVWDNTKEYEPLTIVMHEGSSFTSKTYVPVGVDITNTKYWVETGNLNCLIGNLETKLTQKIDVVNDLVDENTTEILNMQQYVTPEMYGAVGDGITDDSTPIQNALNSGKNVYFSKNYLIDTSLKTTISNIELFGNGKLLVGDNLNVYHPILWVFGEHVKINGLTFDGRKGLTTNEHLACLIICAIRNDESLKDYVQPSYITFTNCIIKNNVGRGLDIGGLLQNDNEIHTYITPIYNVVVTNCLFSNTKLGICQSYTRRVNISDCIFSDHDLEHITVDNGTRLCKIYDNTFINNNHGFGAIGIGWAWEVDIHDNFFAGNSYTKDNIQAIGVGSTNNGLCMNIMIHHNKFDTYLNGVKVISLADGEHASNKKVIGLFINNNNFVNTKEYPINIEVDTLNVGLFKDNIYNSNTPIQISNDNLFRCSIDVEIELDLKSYASNGFVPTKFRTLIKDKICKLEIIGTMETRKTGDIIATLPFKVSKAKRLNAFNGSLPFIAMIRDNQIVCYDIDSNNTNYTTNNDLIYINDSFVM